MYWRAYETTGCAAVERLDRAREDRRASAPRAAAAWRSARSGRCPAPGERIRSAQVGDRRAARRATSGRSSRKNGASCFVAGFDSSTSCSRSSSVRAQVHERRVGLAQRARQQLERPLERRALVADRRASLCSCCPPGRRGRRGARRSRRPCPRRPSRSAGAPAWSSASSVVSSELLAGRAAKYLVALAAPRRRACRTRSPEPRITLLEALARLGVERVEERVEVDRRRLVSSAPMCPPSAIFSFDVRARACSET